MPQGPEPRVDEQFAAAMRLHQGGRLVEAERMYTQILDAHPRHVDALHLLGVLAHQTGRHDAAVVLIGKAIAENPNIPAFHNNLGNARQAQGKLDEAHAAYARALDLNPRHVDAHYNRAVVWQAQGRLNEAIESYGKVLAHKPDHADAHNNLGNALQAQGRLEEALRAYERALHHRPRFADAHNNAGNVLRAQGHADAAIASYTSAIGHDARHADALRNLGIVLLEQGMTAESEAALRRAVALRPADATAHCSLGNTLTELGRAEMAVACFRRALELDHTCAEAALGAATAVIPVFAGGVAESLAAPDEFRRALTELAEWDRGHPGRLGGAVGSHQPFYLAYRNTDVGGLLARYGDLVTAAATTHWKPRALGIRPQRDRLRLVIVCGHARRHPVWDVILRGLVENLDRQRFQIHLYHTSGLHDAETTWAREHVDRFVQGPKPLKAWMAELAGDQPDVIFYPEVGMDPTSGALATLRLAPVQAAGWGHPITTGLPTIDLFFSGELLEGPEADHHYRERLVRLPGTGVCTTAFPVPATPWEAPKAAPGTVRFAICQQPMKFDPADDALLARIAAHCGACEFWLASPAKLQWATDRLRHRLAIAFRNAGLDPDAHLRVMPWLARDQFLGFLDTMDVFLDCPAFSGYTTAWQAVRRGTPVVTLEGQFLRQRLAAGLLKQIGVTEGIVGSGDAYVETAVQFARRSRETDGARGLRESTSAAAIKADDNVGAVRALEHALIDADTARRAHN